MSKVQGEFPVGGLLNGESYKTSTRMSNISAAMTWIQRQLELLKDDDKQLMNLFHKLEMDMAELKSIYNDTSRGRNSSVSSIRDIYAKTSQSSLPLDGHSPSRIRILEETTMEPLIDRSDSDGSLDDFANELGLDDDLEDEEGDTLPRSMISGNRPSIRSHGSGTSLENDIHFTISLPSNHSLPEEEEEESSLDIHGGYISSTSDGSPGNEKRNVRRLSNDSGAVADSDSTGSSAACETKEIKKVAEVTESLTSTLKDEENKRLSGFADEIFAMFKLSN